MGTGLLMKKPFIVLWGFIAGVFLFSWIYLPALSKYQDLKVRQEGMDLQIKELEQKIADIQEERNLLKTDVSYLEKIIRDELGLVKPGEIVYKFVEEKPAPVPPQPFSEEAVAEGTVKTEMKTQTGDSKPAKTPALSVPAKRVIVTPKTVETVKPLVVPKEAAEKPVSSLEPAYPRQETR